MPNNRPKIPDKNLNKRNNDLSANSCQMNYEDNTSDNITQLTNDNYEKNKNLLKNNKPRVAIQGQNINDILPPAHRGNLDNNNIKKMIYNRAKTQPKNVYNSEDTNN